MTAVIKKSTSGGDGHGERSAQGGSRRTGARVSQGYIVALVGGLFATLQRFISRCSRFLQPAIFRRRLSRIPCASMKSSASCASILPGPPTCW